MASTDPDAHTADPDQYDILGYSYIDPLEMCDASSPSQTDTSRQRHTPSPPGAYQSISSCDSPTVYAQSPRASSAPMPVLPPAEPDTRRTRPQMARTTQTCRRTPYYPPNSSRTFDRTRVYMGRGPHYVANWTPLSTLPRALQLEVEDVMLQRFLRELKGDIC